MNEWQKKILRVIPIIRSRKVAVDQEASQLQKIRGEKGQALADLQDYQQRYMKGVEDLNRERSSSQRSMLEALESGVDLLKSRWYHSLKSFREAERRESAQLAQLRIAQQNLRSAEKLQERYMVQIKIIESKDEQKIADDSAIRKHSQSTRR